MKRLAALRSRCSIENWLLSCFFLFSWTKLPMFPTSHSHNYRTQQICCREKDYGQFLFNQPLEATSKAGDIFRVLGWFFTNTGFSWSKLVRTFTDGAAAMLGAKSGLASLAKQKHSEIQGTHCMIHKVALVSKSFPEETARAFVCRN